MNFSFLERLHFETCDVVPQKQQQQQQQRHQHLMKNIWHQKTFRDTIGETSTFNYTNLRKWENQGILNGQQL